MPSFDHSRGALARSSAKAIAIGCHKVGDDDLALTDSGSEIAEALEADLLASLRAVRFDGEVGAVAALPAGHGVNAESLLVYGLGKADDVDGEVLRRAGGALATAAAKAPSLAVALPGVDGLDHESAAQAMVEGIELGSYRFDEFKTDAEAIALEAVTIHGADGADTKTVKRGIATGEATAAAVCLARDLVNAPANAKRPTALAARAKAECKGTGIKVKVLGHDELTKGGYGGILGVSRGSEEPGQLVQLTWSPSGAKKHIVLVGKGITFDSGGLSLKPGGSMMTMKMDMAGAATVLATVKALAELGVKVKVTGLMALAENMPSGSAIRPGDVLHHRGGKTVEVLNTDAEGRLVLADALVHGSDLKPDAIVDMATLTGAALVALGDQIGAIMGTDPEVIAGIREAGERVAEPFWELPLAKDKYDERLKSEVADLRNIPNVSGQAGTVTAGLFLSHFVGEGIPWAHLDIAGIAWTDNGTATYQTKGATGAPVRTLVEWLSRQ